MLDICRYYYIMGDVGGRNSMAECRIVYPVVAGSNPAVLAFVLAHPLRWAYMGVASESEGFG